MNKMIQRLMLVMLSGCCFSLTGCEGGDDDGGGNVDGAILKAMAPVCSGQGVPSAAAYRHIAAAPSPIVLLKNDGGSHFWTDDIPIAWCPNIVEECQLVASATKDYLVLINSQSYSQYPFGGGSGHIIHRYRKDIDVTIYEAKTGSIVSQTPLQGTVPTKPFPETSDGTENDIKGPVPETVDLLNWLRPYVN